MKKLLSLILSLVLVVCVMPTIYAEAESIDVFITVTDITNVDEPFNILVERQKLKVDYFDIEDKYGETFTGIECVEGITFMHAICALHEKLYEPDEVTENLMLTEDGETHIFMGKSIDSIMYKNGEDIFSLPQKVQLHNNDEVNICLYNAGNPQKVASFDKSKIEGVALNEVVSLSLFEHYESPVNKNPIWDAEITDEKGLYILDDNSEIIKTDADGSFDLSFKDKGTYQVSIMPQIEYFYDKNGGTTITEYVPQEVVKKVSKGHWFTYPDFSESEWVEELVEAYNKDYPDKPITESVLAFEWVDNEDEMTYPFYDEVTTTELVKVETFIAGESTQQIAYTPPYCVIEVTDKLLFDDVSLHSDDELGCDTIHLTFKNAEYNSGEVICAAYDGDRYIGVQRKELEQKEVFVFDKGATHYKIMVWESLESVKPVSTAVELNL